MGNSCTRYMIGSMMGNATNCCSKCMLPLFPEPKDLNEKDIMKGRAQTDDFMSKHCVWKPHHFQNVQIDEHMIDNNNIRVKVFSNSLNKSSIAAIYIHGGGFVFGSLDGYSRVCAALSHELDITIICLEYSLAPEYVFPKALVESYRVFEWAQNIASNQYGFNKDRIGVMGDSAGANLCGGLTRLARNIKNKSKLDNPLEFPEELKTEEFQSINVAYQCLIVPVTKRHDESDEYLPIHLIKKQQMKLSWEVYMKDKRSYLAELVEADEFASMPPTILILAGCDSLNKQGKLYGKLLQDDKANIVEVHEFKDMHHCFFTLIDHIDESKQAIQIIQKFLYRYILKDKAVNLSQIEDIKKTEASPLLQ